MRNVRIHHLGLFFVAGRNGKNNIQTQVGQFNSYYVVSDLYLNTDLHLELLVEYSEFPMFEDKQIRGFYLSGGLSKATRCFGGET